MKISTFTELIARQKAHELELVIYKLTEKFPRSKQFGNVCQVRRSAASDAANIAEAFERLTMREFLRSLQIAQGEVEETRYFLMLNRDVGHIVQGDFERASAFCDSVGQLMSALPRSLKPRLQTEHG